MTLVLRMIAAVSCFLLSVGVMAQESKTDSLPDAPSQTQQPTQPNNPLTETAGDNATDGQSDSGQRRGF